MADKDIKIGIKTTADTAGATAAEESLKKVEAAAEGAGGQLGGGAGAGAAGGVAGKAEKANKQLKETAKAADAATGASRSMRAGMQNLSYQAADVAVQLEMGTSAARVFTQQGSQMLAVLGPWGALAGAALAIGGALFTAGQNSGEAAEQVTEDAEEMRKAMESLEQFAADAAEALEMESLGASNEAFAARIAAVDELNKSLGRQLEIAKQLRDIDLQKQDAVAAADIAEIEASDAAPEEKAKRVAKIRAEMDERSRQQQLNAIRLEESKAKLEVEAAKAKEAAAKANFDANKENFDRNEKAVQEAEAAFAKAPDEIARLKAELEELKIRDAKGRLAYGSEGGGEAGMKFREGIEAREFNLKSDIRMQSPDKLAETLDTAAKYRDAAKDELKAAEDALKDAQRNASVATEKESGVKQISTAQRDLINTQGGSAARISESQRIAEERKQKQAEDERKRREEEQRQREEERRRNAGRDLEADITGMGRDAAKATRALGGRESLAEGFEKVSRKIARKGDPQGDVSSLSSMLEKLSILVDAIPDSKSASPDAEKLRALERKMEKKIADLREQVKRDRK